MNKSLISKARRYQRLKIKRLIDVRLTIVLAFVNTMFTNVTYNLCI